MTPEQDKGYPKIWISIWPLMSNKTVGEVVNSIDPD